MRLDAGRIQREMVDTEEIALEKIALWAIAYGIVAHGFGPLREDERIGFLAVC